MRLPEKLCLLVLLVLVVGCYDAPERHHPTDRPTLEANFAAYARALFAELRSEPMDSTLETEIGLFGDLTVGGGERTVMRRYRYRVDSTAHGSFAYMAFQVRDTAEQFVSVPVVLSFVPVDDGWHLESVRHGEVAGDPEPDPPMANGQTKLHESLATHLDAWLDGAVASTGMR